MYDMMGACIEPERAAPESEVTEPEGASVCVAYVVVGWAIEVVTEPPTKLVWEPE